MASGGRGRGGGARRCRNRTIGRSYGRSRGVRMHGPAAALCCVATVLIFVGMGVLVPGIVFITVDISTYIAISLLATGGVLTFLGIILLVSACKKKQEQHVTDVATVQHGGVTMTTGAVTMTTGPDGTIIMNPGAQVVGVQPQQPQAQNMQFFHQAHLAQAGAYGQPVVYGTDQPPNSGPPPPAYGQPPAYNTGQPTPAYGLPPAYPGQPAPAYGQQPTYGADFNTTYSQPIADPSAQPQPMVAYPNLPKAS